jgi:hypothetical protein
MRPHGGSESHSDESCLAFSANGYNPYFSTFSLTEEFLEEVTGFWFLVAQLESEGFFKEEGRHIFTELYTPVHFPHWKVR